MTHSDWDRLADLFERALAQPDESRRAFLREACGGDHALERELRAMLVAVEDSAELSLERKLLSWEDDATGDSDALPAGTRVGAWRIGDPIGHGGMGEVYRASRADGDFSQTVAIKVMRHDVRGVAALRRFRTERMLLARLSHPNISAIVDGGTAPDGRPFLAMQFVDGVPITRYCDEHHLDLDSRLRLFTTVAHAVHHAHVRLIVHRDIKPSNILVSTDGRPVLLDFGIAKLLDRNDAAPDRTQTSHRLLTPEHAAPEQVRGEPVSTATDVYGLGVLLFELVTGVRPFRGAGRSASDLEHAIVHDEPPTPSAVATRLPERARIRGDLDRIVGMALRKEPDRRYGSAEQFAEDVTRWIGRMPVRAQRDTFTYRARQFVRRNRGAVAGATAFVVLLAASGIVASLQARARSRERDTAVREQAMAEDVVRVLTDLLKQSDPRVLPGGDTMRVKSFLDRADTELESLTEQPERQLRLRRVMADVRASRGEYAIAESLLAAAYRRGQTALGARHIEVLRTRQSLARAMVSHRGPQVARPLLDSVLGEMRTTLGTGNDDVASAYVDLATATTNPEVATALIDTSIALRAKIGTGRDSLSIANLLDAQGAQHFVRGEFAEARALFSAALRILDARLPPDHVTRLSTLGNLAATENELANWTAAERLATEILTYERKTTIGAEGVARSLEQLAVIHANLGQFAKAETEERESITQLRTRMDPSHELIDNSLRNLAIIVSAGGKPKAGLALLDSVVARRRMAGDSALAAYMEAQRVPMLLRLGRAREAPASVVALNALLPTLAQASRWHGDAAMYAGMAAMANAQHAVALNRLTTAVARFDARYPRDHPRRAMAHCALGAAMAYQHVSRAAAPHLVPACDRLATWALADSSVAAWGRRARQMVRAP